MTDYDNVFDLAEFKNKLENLAKTYNEEGEALKKLEADYRAANELVKTIYKRMQEIEGNRSVLAVEIGRNKREVERQERLAEAKAKRDALKREYEVKAEEFARLTKDCGWRIGEQQAFDHQIDGATRLAVAKRGILADKRGLGKTLTSIAWLDMLEAKRVLVLAPNDICTQFEEEIRTWAPERRLFSLRGLDPASRAIIYPMLNIVDDFIVVLNYEAWRKDKTIVDDLVKAGIDTMICDEAHKIKSSSKLTARGVFQIAYRPNYCSSCKEVDNYAGAWYPNGTAKDANCETQTYSHSACSRVLESTVKNVLTMTGTPILNKPQELFSLLYLVSPITYPAEKAFLRDYCYQYNTNRWMFAPGGLKRLTNFMSSFFVQRTREDAGIQIPPPAIHVYDIEKDRVKYPRQYKAENDLRQAAALVLENGDTHNMLYILEIILRERQCMTWPAGIILRDPETKEIICNFDVKESQKLDEAVDLIAELLEEEERIIVFSKFKAPLYEAHERISKLNYKSVVATGDQTDWQRQQVKTDFDLKTAPENPRWNVCFATYDAFATGLNLNAARHVVLLDDEWSPGYEDQAIGRIDRLNSVDQANVHIFRVNKSIDDFMANLLEEKKKITEGFESSVTAADLLSHLRDG